MLPKCSFWSIRWPLVLQRCSGQGDSLSVVFLSDGLKQLLADAKEIHLDGTFKTRPRHPSSSQFFTIMAVLYGYAFPCAFVLMASRKTSAYDLVFEKLKEIVPQFKLQLFMSDFEVSLVTSLQRNFPLARKTGCFFHYCQALLRKAQSLDMTRLLKTNKQAKHALKMLMAVALLPENSIKDGDRYITNFVTQKSLLENFQTLLAYHRRQWLQKVGVDSPSVYNRARRTNNDSESFHATLKRLFRVQGPNGWEFTDGLRNISSTTSREIEAFIYEGLQIRSMEKRRYRLNDHKIKQATTNFLNNNDVGRLLNTTSYSVERLVQSTLVEDYEDTDAEEFLLARLASDVPPEFTVDNAVTNDLNEASLPIDEELVSEEAALLENSQPSSEQENRQQTCMICHTDPPTTILLPCKHFGLCCECCKIRQQLSTICPTAEDVAFENVINHAICPLDRIPVTEYVRVIPT